MSNIGAVIKVTDHLISRVLDQRQFTTGEINYVVNEIGGQTNLDGNFDKLLRVNENVCLIADTSNPELCKSYDTKVKDVCNQVDSLRAKAEQILKTGNEFQLDRERRLSEERNLLESSKQECLMSCRTKLERLKESSVEEELELERKYLRFEENLRNK